MKRLPIRTTTPAASARKTCRREVYLRRPVWLGDNRGVSQTRVALMWNHVTWGWHRLHMYVHRADVSCHRHCQTEAPWVQITELSGVFWKGKRGCSKVKDLPWGGGSEAQKSALPVCKYRVTTRSCTVFCSVWAFSGRWLSRLLPLLSTISSRLYVKGML